MQVVTGMLGGLSQLIIIETLERRQALLKLVWMSACDTKQYFVNITNVQAYLLAKAVFLFDFNSIDVNPIFIAR